MCRDRWIIVLKQSLRSECDLGDGPHRGPLVEAQLVEGGGLETHRPGEEHGVHYHFVQVEEFKALIERGDFLEWAEVFGNYYGTSRAAIEACLARGIDVFLDIDWQGARQIREQMPTKSIFILPPSREELERRLIGRGQDSSEVIAGRMAKAIAEMVHYDEYDYVIINEDFEQALFQLRAIIECQRLALHQQQQAQQNLLQQLLAE